MMQAYIINSPAIEKISGTIKNYKQTRKSANFIFTKNNKNTFGVIAVAAVLADAPGLAVSSAASANAEEEADYIEFDLDGRSVKGWVWRSPFVNGDIVDVIAERMDDHFEAYGIARPKDRIVALYPHCSRGRTAHWINALKWWFKGVTIMLLFGTIFFGLGCVALSDTWYETGTFLLDMMPAMALFFYPTFLLMTISLGWKWMSFVRVAERVFTAFGWDRASDIDLKRRSKGTKTGADENGFGVFFFRY